MTTKNLVLWLQGLGSDTRHAQQVMKDLGIDYIAAIPQPIADCWHFWGCTNVPDPLPDYFSEFQSSPWGVPGLSVEAQAALGKIWASKTRPS